jgi:hypothetical protein
MNFSKLIPLALLTLSCQNVFAHAGHYNKAPYDACVDLSVNASCEYTDVNETVLYVGTCQVFSDVNMCVRNKPLVFLKKKATEVKPIAAEATADSATINDY